MGKTILKLHANGDFETVNLPLIQSNVIGNYKFSENSITVPKIIEYPNEEYKNYFIEKTSVPGWTIGYDVYPSSGNNDRTSDFIKVEGWNYISIRVAFENLGSLIPEFRILFYNSNKEYVWTLNHSDFQSSIVEGEKIFTMSLPLSTEVYSRISINHYDDPNVNVKIDINNTQQVTQKHYIAFEDIPDWVRDTGNPVSFFSQGVVIKGRLIK